MVRGVKMVLREERERGEKMEKDEGEYEEKEREVEEEIECFSVDSLEQDKGARTKSNGFIP